MDSTDDTSQDKEHARLLLQVLKSLKTLSTSKLREVHELIDNFTRETPSKEELLDHLQSHAYVQLGASPIHGVGVFAVQRIPEGKKRKGFFFPSPFPLPFPLSCSTKFVGIGYVLE